MFLDRTHLQYLKPLVSVFDSFISIHGFICSKKMITYYE